MSDVDSHTPGQPVSAEWDVTACGAVALVAIRLANPTGIAQPIRLDNRLAGPVLPPRRHGVPEEGWDAEGFAGAVPPGGRLALGYACPLANEEQGRETTKVTDPPIEIRGDRSGRDENETTTAAAVVRDLGESRPPADVVPLAGARTEIGTTDEAERGSERSASDEPQPPTAWLDAVEERIERAERLDGASVGEATRILRDRGGVAGVEAEAQRLRRDARALDDTAARAGALAARADAAEVPVDALWRLT